MPDSSSTPVRAIFLSYARQDSEPAQRIAVALRALGIEVWFDQTELRGGEAWDSKIRKQIRECALFIAVISANTQAREEGYFRREWRQAVDRTQDMAESRVFILPVIVDDTKESSANVPEQFLKVHCSRLPGGEMTPQFLEQVRKVLQLGAPPSPAASPTPSAAAAPATPAGASIPLWGKMAATAALAAIVAGLYWATSRTPATAVPPSNPAKSAELSSEAVSLAVLPFVDMSQGKDQEYLSDGISEELLTVLQKIPGLRVAARTSAFSFKGKSATAQEIGEKLAVAHLVEGSVQRAGERVKITVRLSRANTGQEVWAQSYTREVKDVFALQEELSLAIVGELRGQLHMADSAAAAKAAVKGGTAKPEALEQYLQGKYFANRFTQENLAKAEVYLQRAVELDPSFALSWAALARAYALDAEYGGGYNQQDFQRRVSLARTAVNRALALEPRLLEALLASLEIQFGLELDWKGAKETLRQAQAVAPDDAAVLLNASRPYTLRGDAPGALPLLRRAVSLDPANPEMRSYYGSALGDAGQHAAARAEYARMQEISPEAPWAFAGAAAIDIYEGHFPAAIAKVQSEAQEYARDVVLAIAYWQNGQRAESEAALRRLIDQNQETAAYQIAQVYAVRRDGDLAFSWLERARGQHDGGLTELRIDPFLAVLHPDPRWEKLLRELDLADDQLP